MAATPQSGSMIFMGRSGRMYSKDVYVSDVAAALINMDSGAGASATSEKFWTPPEPVLLNDFSLVTGTADTTKLQVTRNGVPTGDILRYAIHLTTLNNRPRLNIPFIPGDKVGALQLA